MVFAVTILSWLTLQCGNVLAGSTPVLPLDIDVWPGCTYWFDSIGEMTCLEAVSYWQITLEDLVNWNPSLSIEDGSCVGWSDYHGYCVEAFVMPTTTQPTATSTAPSTTSTTARPKATWISRGCYLDNGVATLANRTTIPGGDGALTPDLCGTACWTSGFTFAGTERGDECWCGNSIRNELATDANSTCAMPCAGNTLLTCGGYKRIDVMEGKPLVESGGTSKAPASSLAPVMPNPAGFPVFPMKPTTAPMSFSVVPMPTALETCLFTIH